MQKCFIVYYIYPQHTAHALEHVNMQIIIGIVQLCCFMLAIRDLQPSFSKLVNFWTFPYNMYEYYTDIFTTCFSCLGFSILESMEYYMDKRLKSVVSPAVQHPNTLEVLCGHNVHTHTTISIDDINNELITKPCRLIEL